MKHRSKVQVPAQANASRALTIRLATPADDPALRRLAQLDSAPPPRPGPTLVAEVGGELHAALALDGGPPIADPFRRTAELVSLLATRARGSEARTQAAPHRLPALMHLLRPTSLLRA